MDDAEIERLTLDLSSLGTIDPETREAIIEEFHQMIANRYVTQGGVDYAKTILESALGPERPRS